MFLHMFNLSYTCAYLKVKIFLDFVCLQPLCVMVKILYEIKKTKKKKFKKKEKKAIWLRIMIYKQIKILFIFQPYF